MIIIYILANHHVDASIHSNKMYLIHLILNYSTIMGFGYKQILENKSAKKSHHFKLIREMIHAKKSLGIEPKEKAIDHDESKIQVNDRMVEYEESNIPFKTREEREHERRDKIEKRKQQSKRLTKKTKYGQPIIKHQIDNLLEKIKKNM